MSNIIIEGGGELSGTIVPSGNKNSFLPILCATLLTDETVELKNVPDLTDGAKILNVLKVIGSEIEEVPGENSLIINNSKTDISRFGSSLPVDMRASLLLLAPLLQRFGRIKVQRDFGGCTLGIREIDPHLKMLEQVGAKVTQNDREIEIIADPFTGHEVWPDYATVTGTENIIMAAVLGKSRTVLQNAASEPHVQDLCNFLISMGAKIEGVGSNRLIIDGVDRLSGTSFKITTDHHEVTTFLALGAMTGGRVEVKNAIPEHFPLIVNAFKKLGVEIKYEGDTAIVEKGQSFELEVPFTENLIPKIEAAPWPYFPVDLLPLMIALSTKTKGTVKFWNKVYEAGLFWVTELTKMGATIEMSDPHRILVFGPSKLQGATINCPYIIRATVALMMAAMTAEGKSTLTNIDSIYRAHPNFLENLTMLGAKIQKVEDGN
jgi:UDP-N-acetylglucosamine 1-carboxyvinyltransferase